jgi:hypothetical protein
MKNKYLLLLLFFCTCAFSQTMTEKYNSILGRYEYFDGQGNLTGYKVYDSLFKEWKYYQVEVQSYERKPIQYAKPPTDDNFALLAETAMRMDREYSSNNSYDNKEQWARKKLYENEDKFYQKDVKISKQILSESNKIYKNLAKMELLDIENLDDGWYEIILKMVANGKGDEAYGKGKVEIYNKKIINYLDDFNTIFKTEESGFERISKVYTFNRIFPDGKHSKTSMTCYFINDKKIKTPAFHEAVTVMFYTKDSFDGKHILIRVYDSKDEENTIKVFLETSFYNNQEPTCEGDFNVCKVYLPKNKVFKYFAVSETAFWQSSFNTSSDCQRIKLNN